MLRLFYLLLPITAVLCGKITILDMGKTIKSFSVSGCDYRSCPLRNGEIKRLNLTFVANQDSLTLRGLTWAFDNGTVAQITNFNPNGCSVDQNSWLSPACPLRKGRTYSIIRIWTVVNAVPGTKPLIIGQWFGDRGQILYEAAQFNVVG